MASQIARLTIVYSTVYSGAVQRKHQSSTSQAFVLGIHRLLVNSPHKGPVTRQMSPFDDVIIHLTDINESKMWWKCLLACISCKIKNLAWSFKTCCIMPEMGQNQPNARSVSWFCICTFIPVISMICFFSLIWSSLVITIVVHIFLPSTKVQGFYFQQKYNTIT